MIRRLNQTKIPANWQGLVDWKVGNSKQAEIPGFLEGFKPPMHIQLEINVADVGAKRGWGNHHLAGDLWNVQVRI